MILSSKALWRYDMVLDFGMLREFIQQVKDEWDHALILPKALSWMYEKNRSLKKVVVFDKNPTAEVMAHLLWQRLADYLWARGCLDIHVERVRVQETATGWGEYSSE
jgi:6-pyruvoyl-tetrahydropterin synthase